MVYAISVFFPGYKNVGGYHSKYSIQTFYEKMRRSGITPTKWLIGWQRFTIPGMLLENEYDNGLEIPACVEFKVIPHVMTPLKVFKFLYNLVPENETVLFVDFLWNDFPFLPPAEKEPPIEIKVNFQENEDFFYETLMCFKKKADEIVINENDEIIIKISLKDKEKITPKHVEVSRKLVSLEEIAILEFYEQKYPLMNTDSCRSIQFLGGKLNVTVPSESKKVRFLLPQKKSSESPPSESSPSPSSESSSPSSDSSSSSSSDSSRRKIVF
jgi:hypothetical protein